MPSPLRTRSLRPLLLTCAVLAPASLSAAAIHLLGPLSLDSFNYTLGVAADGTAIGYSDDFEAVTPVFWSKTGAGYGAPAALSLLSGGETGQTRWISADASLIAGRVSVPAGEGLPDYKPVVWSRAGAGSYAVAALPRLGPAPAEGAVTAGTATGSRFVGHDGADFTAAVWRRSGSGYTVQALPLPAAADGPSFANAISADGARIAGRYTVDDAAQAVVWTETGGSYAHRALQVLAGGVESFAETISPDGTLAAGASDSPRGMVPVKWDAASGAVTALETLPGDLGTVAAISEDKHWLGGCSTDADTFAGGAVLWDHAGRIHDLVTLAAGAGAAFEGFTPESVTGIHRVSTGVYTIVGTGVVLDSGYTRGFVLENLALGSPAPIPDPEPGPSPRIVGSVNLDGVYMSRNRPAGEDATPRENPASRAPLGSSPARSRSAHLAAPPAAVTAEPSVNTTATDSARSARASRFGR